MYTPSSSSERLKLPTWSLGVVPWTSDQFLPCCLKEVSAKRTLRPFDNIPSDACVGLASNGWLIPMYRGFKLILKEGIAWIENPELPRALSGKGLTLAELQFRGWKKELEILNAMRMVSIQPKKTKLSEYVIPSRYRALYKKDMYGWFSYVPARLSIDITNNCNLRCVHCSKNASIGRRKPKELSYNELSRVIREAADFGIKSLSLMGGEPTIHPKLFRLCKQARKAGFRNIFTSTNGWLVDKKMADALATVMNNVQVSLHGARAETHDRIVGRPGAYHRAIRAVRLLSKRGVSVNISFTVMHINSAEMRDAVGIAIDSEARSIRFLGLNNHGRGCNLKQLTQEDRHYFSQEVDNLRKAFKDTSIKINTGGFPLTTEPNDHSIVYGCPAGRDLLHINFDGEVTPCGNIDSMEKNIRDYTLEELWHQESMRTMRRTLLCKCAFTPVCAGPCLANQSFKNRIWKLPSMDQKTEGSKN